MHLMALSQIKKNLSDKLKDGTAFADKKEEINLTESQGKILFVTNLNFITKEHSLKRLFSEKKIPSKGCKNCNT